MAKYYGEIGYGIASESAVDVWKEHLIRRNYYGEVIQNFNRRWDTGQGLNDNLNINNKISIVADPFANENFRFIRYIKWMGAKWKVTNVEVQFPRLILTIGGLYNAEE